MDVLFGTGPGPPGGEGASRPRWSPGSRRCGRPAQGVRRAEAGARLSRRPGPPRAAGRGPGQTPASASSWGRSVGLPGPSRQICPPAPAKTKTCEYPTAEPLSRRRRHFQKSVGHGGGYCARRGGARATSPRPQPCLLGSEPAEETATRLCPVRRRPHCPRPRGQPATPAPGSKALPGASRAAGRGRGGRQKGGGPGRRSAARPVPGSVTCPRQPPNCRRRRPGSEQAVVRTAETGDG